MSRDLEVSSAVLQSTYASGARTGQGSLPPAPVTSAVLQSTYPSGPHTGLTTYATSPHYHDEHLQMRASEITAVFIAATAKDAAAVLNRLIH